MLIALGMIVVSSMMIYQPADVREPEPHVELPTSYVNDHNPEDVDHQTVGLTVQVLPETYSTVCGRPLRQ